MLDHDLAFHSGMFYPRSSGANRMIARCLGGKLCGTAVLSHPLDADYDLVRHLPRLSYFHLLGHRVLICHQHN